MPFLPSHVYLLMTTRSCIFFVCYWPYLPACANSKKKSMFWDKCLSHNKVIVRVFKTKEIWYDVSTCKLCELVVVFLIHYQLSCSLLAHQPECIKTALCTKTCQTVFTVADLFAFCLAAWLFKCYSCNCCSRWPRLLRKQQRTLYVDWNVYSRKPKNETKISHTCLD